MDEKINSWGELCERLKLDLGNTPADSPVQKLLSAPNINIPTSTTDLKSKGFTKLVRRGQRRLRKRHGNGQGKTLRQSGGPV